MPLKKNTKTRASSSTAKSKRTSLFKDDKVGSKTAPMVTALKENNRCLASALDESRHEYRELQESFLKLQQERQKLLEKVASLENQLLKQDHQLFAIHVQPSLQLLSQAEKDIKHAKEYLKRLFVPATVASSGIPQFLSPIRESHGGRKCDDISSCVKFGSEAEAQHASEKPKAVYPKTPHPAASLKSPQLSSTPVKEGQSDTQSPILACSPRAIDFEESTLPYSKSNDVAARRKKSEVMGSHKAKKVLPIEHSQTEVKEEGSNAATIVSPELPENENRRAESTEVGIINHGLNVTELLQRPRRRCSSLNISYQEPSLNRKLRRGDPFTTENPGFLNGEKAKIKDFHSTEKAVRGTLTDVTNKK